MMRLLRQNARRSLHAMTLAGVVVALSMAGGCSVLHGGPGGVLTLSGADGAHRFAPDYSTAAYKTVDADTFDVYLSDLPRERLTNPGDLLGGATGNLVHVHIFLTPDAGNTPIDSTACNFTVRHLVLAGGTADAPVMGLYAGGGFLATSGAILGGGINGTVSAASERLNRSTASFKDLLGSASLSGRFSASEDEKLAEALSAKLELLVSRLPVAAKEEPKPAPKKTPAKADKKDADKKSDDKKTGEKSDSAKPDAAAKPAK